MSPLRIVIITALAMLAFAANSVLNRLALTETGIDAGSFTFLRLLSGALFLTLLVLFTHRSFRLAGNGFSALALCIYAAGFSFAYRELPAATGALLLFGAVQASMIIAGVKQGERPQAWQFAGLLVAFAGVVYLLLPGASAPPPLAAFLMVVAGVSWGVYSLRGRGQADPLLNTCGNFIRSVPFAVLALLVMQLVNHITAGSSLWPQSDRSGILYAVASGALASGGGYALWYLVLPYMQSVTAATVQLTVPALTALGGALLAGEIPDQRLLISSLLILGGVAVFIRCRPDNLS